MQTDDGKGEEIDAGSPLTSAMCDLCSAVCFVIAVRAFQKKVEVQCCLFP